MVPAAAGTSLSIEAGSDERRRGLSWSDGKTVARSSVSAEIIDRLSLDASAVTLRGSRRHGGADAGIDLRANYMRQMGAWRLSGAVTHRLFPGASGMAYSELGGSADMLIGPASLGLFLHYAPDQKAIGGDNLYVGAAGSVGLPGLPLTLSAHVGRSSGTVDDAQRAARLRPDGRYWDHGVALDYYKDIMSVGLRYTDSSVDVPGARGGATWIGSVGVRF